MTGDERVPATVIEGLVGSGKNLYLVNCAANHPTDYPIYANFTIELPNFKYLRLIDLLSLPKNCTVFFDEAYTWFESRTSMKYINQFASYILFQLRKTQRNIFLTCQDFSSIDVRYRRMWDYFIHCEAIPEMGFSYEVFNKKMQKTRIGLPLEYCQENLYHLYDTWEIIEPEAKSRIEYELLKTEPLQYLKQAVKITKKLNKIPKEKITKERVKLNLMGQNIDPIWADPVYVILKS